MVFYHAAEKEASKAGRSFVELGTFWVVAIHF